MLQIIQTRDFTRGVPRQREGKFVCWNAYSIIPHAEQLNTPLFNINLYVSGSSVETVLQQFLDNRRRALNNLPGGYLVYGEPWPIQSPLELRLGKFMGFSWWINATKPLGD